MPGADIETGARRSSGGSGKCRSRGLAAGADPCRGGRKAEIWEAALIPPSSRPASAGCGGGEKCIVGMPCWIACAGA